MLRKMLIIAGALSVVSISANAAEQTTITEPTTISTEVDGVITNGIYGGAIINYNQALTIKANITNNELTQGRSDTAAFGAGIYQSGGTLTIKDGVTFSGNVVTGGSQTYEGWEGTDSASGGAIYITNGKTIAEGTVTFSNNEAQAYQEGGESNGGAIFAQGGSATFNNVTFTNNSSVTRGGAIYNGDTDIEIEGKGEFSGNTSKTGGAVYNLDTTGNTKFTTGDKSTFTNNKATGNGGAIANFDGEVNIGTNNSFSGNTAEGKGGAIYNANWQNTAVTNIYGGTEFSENTASDVGGAIYTTGTVNLDTTAGDITFSNNKATNGGADLYLDGKDASLVVSGTKGEYKVSFGSENSIGGDGNITHQSAGTFEIAGNTDLSGFTGKYTQTSGKTSLVGSTMFSNYEITNGALELKDGSTATIDSKNNKIFSGTDLIVESESELTLMDTIGSAVNVAIRETGTVNLEGVGLTIDSTDTWLGTINSNAGQLTVDGYQGDSDGNKNVTYTQTGNGELNLTNGADITLKDNNSSISAGSVNVKGNSTLTVANGATINGSANTTATNGSTVNVNGGVLGDSESTGKIDLQQGSTLNVTNSGSVTVHSKDNLGGAINLGTAESTTDASALVLDGYNGSITYKQNSGSVTLQNSADITLKDGNSSISAGNVNVTGNSTLTVANGAEINGLTDTTIESGSSLTVDNGTLDSSGTTTINQEATLNIKNGGEVTLHSGDTWEGTVNLGTKGQEDTTSTLTVESNGNTGELHAENGNLIINANELTVGQNSYIKEEVKIQTAANIKITGNGSVTIDNLDELNTGAKLTLNGGTLEYKKSDDDASALVEGDAGTLRLWSGSTLTIGEDSNIGDGVVLEILNDAKLNLASGSTLILDSNDSWFGHINNEGGIYAQGVTNAEGSISQKDGVLELTQASKITLNNKSEISGGDINIQEGSSLSITDASVTGGNMTIDKDSSFIVKSAENGNFALTSLNATGAKDGDVIQAPLINTMNAQLNRASIGTLNITEQANFNIDILGRSSLRNDSDKFTISNVENNGTIKIDDWQFYGDVYGYDAPVDRHVKLGDIFVDNEGNQIEASIETTDKTNFSPIGWYQLNKGMGAGGYTLDLVKYNPQVFRGQVATVSQWMNQLAIEDMLFTHSMVLPSFKEEDGGKMANHYASADALFSPYQYSRKDGGIWVKTYGTFEHLQMSNGLKHVGNNSYGTLIGADFGLKDLKNGWKFMPTAYVGYNGAHQYWSKVSQYQNGGQAGFLGTWYKDNFILGAMAYGGVYGNAMDVYGHTDETFNYFAGTAAKASYNVRVHRDFVIQPNLLASYNYFGQQNWHSNFGQMGMMSGMLHGVNIAPGVNFIWERDTFSAYLTLQYMYNVNGASGGRAGNVDLPNLVMQRGYIQYGIGFTKKFTDRASGYLQAVLRNAGRTGVGLQAGFLFRIGK